jgi:hypothetical protein
MSLLWAPSFTDHQTTMTPKNNTNTHAKLERTKKRPSNANKDIGANQGRCHADAAASKKTEATIKKAIKYV